MACAIEAHPATVGKTHTLVTLTHLFRDPTALPDLPAVKEFVSAMGGQAPKARIAAVCFDKLDPELGVPVLSPSGEERTLKHPWSVIAFQIAGADGLCALRADGKAEERDTPPRDLPLEKLLGIPSKEGFSTLILFDEVLMYAGEKAKDPIHGAQFREQFLNFLQSLTQAVAKVSTASMIVSLLASDPKRDDPFGRQLLSDMSNILGRKEDEAFQPVGKDDVAEILRRRLLDPETTKDPEALRQRYVAVCEALVRLHEMRRMVRASGPAAKSLPELDPFIPAIASGQIEAEIDPDPRLIVFGFDGDQRDGRWDRDAKRLRDYQPSLNIRAIGNTRSTREFF